MRTSSKPHASASLTDHAAKAAALAERIIADARSGAFRGIAVAYVSSNGPEIHADNAIWFDQTDRMAALVLANQLFELVKPGFEVAPHASRAN